MDLPAAPFECPSSFPEPGAGVPKKSPQIPSKGPEDSMTQDHYNAFCASLAATSHVVQWGGADVWKVGGKVFAIGWFDDGDEPGITFKVSPIAYEMLKDQQGLRPAPYLASRGMSWIQHHQKPGLADDDLKGYLTESHRIVAGGLSKKKQRDLGLLEA
jgi:predicted DNA-binding protein (MmcQ/YjbR family)